LKKKLSDKDQRDWNKFVNEKSHLFDKDEVSSQKVNKKEISIDLHGYTLRDANIAVNNLIVKSYNQNIKKIEVITGKGMRSKVLENPYKSKDLSILKYSVPEYINNNKSLMDKIKKINLEDVNNLNRGSFSIYLRAKK
jgi:DNA-nicking Smr family endonuclease